MSVLVLRWVRYFAMAMFDNVVQNCSEGSTAYCLSVEPAVLALGTPDLLSARWLCQALADRRLVRSCKCNVIAFFFRGFCAVMTWIFTKNWRKDWDVAENKQQCFESYKENIIFRTVNQLVSLSPAETQEGTANASGGSPEADTCGQDSSVGASQDASERSSLGQSLNSSNSVLKDVDTLASSTANTESACSQTGSVSTGTVLPWGAHKERSPYPPCINIDMDIRPGEFVMRTLFADFTVQAEKKMEAVMAESLTRAVTGLTFWLVTGLWLLYKLGAWFDDTTKSDVGIPVLCNASLLTASGLPGLGVARDGICHGCWCLLELMPSSSAKLVLLGCWFCYIQWYMESLVEVGDDFVWLASGLGGKLAWGRKIASIPESVVRSCDYLMLMPGGCLDFVINWWASSQNLNSELLLEGGRALTTLTSVAAHAVSHNIDFDSCYSTRVVRALPSSSSSSDLRRWESAHQFITKSRQPQWP
ncbi:hypothetical protein PR048_021946 [Dryococelus australis]|uniref:Uncharacterized protein n=1 Tax=Dryococelus australis TaxID=614101 RepID=A0ABQ9GZV7_9NEOP|nr:hypothetical protein PR048_021946 [Dryococelus australis]